MGAGAGLETLGQCEKTLNGQCEGCSDGCFGSVKIAMYAAVSAFIYTSGETLNLEALFTHTDIQPDTNIQKYRPDITVTLCPLGNHTLFALYSVPSRAMVSNLH